jgi:peptide/nickel transport system substrate-binding protein
MKKAIFTLLILALLGTGAYFGKDYYLPYLLPSLEKDTLKIAFNTEATDLSPYGLNLNNLTRIRNMYEGLVAFDRNLKVIPALAVSWGNLDDHTWEFRLRSGVKFHDGSDFTAQDVIDSFEAAKASGNAQITPEIETIREVRISAPDKVEVITYAPDPLLLSKLTKLLIHKGDHIGTGPYMFDEWVQGDHLSLKVFPDYWGQAPAFAKADYEVILARAERQKAFDEKKIDILFGITEEQALDLPEERVKQVYGLEVNFIMFKLDDPIFGDKKMRENIRTLFDPECLEDIGNGFVRPSNQFIAPGVFGYNQEIEDCEYSEENEARDLFGNRLEPLEVDYLSSYRTLSEYISSQLRLAGFSVTPIAREPDELLELIRNNESRFYVIGWRAADGDAGGFFDAFIHSDGSFNRGRYVNEEVDSLIEESRREMDPQKRLSLLQEIGAKVSEDLIGIPLFETSRLYGVNQGIEWEPRLDGQVLAAEVSR